jgi:antitoxin (DNA-binding transcriptional repressor) of toxin-antitoxin stability system
MGSSVTVRELQKDLKRVLARVERGQTLQVTRRRRPVAILAPPRPAAVQPWPDLDARAQSVLGDRIISPAPSELLAGERGER